MLTLPRLYAIADAGLLARKNISLVSFATEMRDAGVTLLQYRDKAGTPRQILDNAAAIKEIFAGIDCMLVLNDRADLAKLAGWHGLHIGQEDLSPSGARNVLGDEAILGVSTHNEAQLLDADAGEADYIAVGPIFATSSKENPDPVVGLDGLRRARALTKKPLVAIGGITRQNMASVIAAGADSVAVISDLMPHDESPQKSARDFLLHLR
jgi:thiamine-phosphate pyrophosphorylase